MSTIEGVRLAVRSADGPATLGRLDFSTNVLSAKIMRTTAAKMLLRIVFSVCKQSCKQ